MQNPLTHKMIMLGGTLLLCAASNTLGIGVCAYYFARESGNCRLGSDEKD